MGLTASPGIPSFPVVGHSGEMLETNTMRILTFENKNDRCLPDQ